MFLDRHENLGDARIERRPQLDSVWALLRAGDCRAALSALHRFLDRSTDPAEHAIAAALIARESARLGALDDAHAWLRSAQRSERFAKDGAGALRLAEADAFVALRAGDPVQAIRIVREHLSCQDTRGAVVPSAPGSPGRAPAGPGQSTAPHGASSRRDASDGAAAGELLVIEAEAEVMLHEFALAEEILGTLAKTESAEMRVRALLQLADARLWEYLVTSLEPIAGPAAGAIQPGRPCRAALLEDARALLHRCEVTEGHSRGTRLELAAGFARARLFAAFSYGDAHVLESYAQGLAQRGLNLDCTRERVMIAFVHGLHGRHVQARAWSEAPARTALAHTHGAVTLEALLVQASALRALGETDAAERLAHTYREKRLAFLGDRSQLVDLLNDAGPRARRSAAQLVQSATQHWTRGVVSIDSLAERVGVSRRSLEIAFRRVTGQSPRIYLNALRLARAGQDIAAMAAAPAALMPSVSDCARRYGFSSARAFNRAFLQLFGVAARDALRYPELIARGPVAPLGPLGPLSPMSPMSPMSSLGPLGPLAPHGPLAAIGAMGEMGAMDPLDQVDPEQERLAWNGSSETTAGDAGAPLDDGPDWPVAEVGEGIRATGFGRANLAR